MQDIQQYSSHPAYPTHYTTTRASKPRDPFKTPEKRTKARNYSPPKKSMVYEQSTFE